MNLKNSPKKQNGFYGRRFAKRLSIERETALNERLPKLNITLKQNEKITQTDLFDHSPQEMHLEVGCGMGDFLAHQITHNSNIAYVGIEAFLTGVGALLTKVPEDIALKNLRLWANDAFELLPNLDDNLFDTIYVLFPDPWPKKRHHKRRIINPVFLSHMVRLLKPSGTLYVASDHDDYKPWIETHLDQTHGLKKVWITEEKPDFMQITTRFEEKAADNGRIPLYFCYEKTEEKS